MFESLSDKLKRTLKNLRGEGVLTKEHVDAALREIRLALLEADVNYKVAKDFIASVSKRPKDSRFGRNSSRLSRSSRLFLTNWLSCSAANRRGSSLPNRYQTRDGGWPAGFRQDDLDRKDRALAGANQDRKPLLLSVDVYRPAAREQLKVIAKATGQQIFEYPETNDPLTLVREASKARAANWLRHAADRHSRTPAHRR
jgi:signal recognition particle subunit SRP54